MRFMIPAFRMVDLHDSRRTPLSNDIPPVPEDRPGLRDNSYCMAAWAILEHLREVETRGAFEFVDLSSFASDHAASFGLCPEDVLWVAQTLATATDARWPGGSTRQTAPLKKMRRGHAYMLDQVGRELLAYVAGYFRWVHAGIEARKLVLDLEMGDFASFREMANRMLMKIRTELFDLRQLQERPGINALVDGFVAEADRFTKTISDVTKVVGEAQSTLRNATTRGELERWSSAAGEDLEDIVGEAHDTLSRIFTANAGLQRAMADFIGEVQSRRRALVGVVRFDQAADSFLRAGGGPPADPGFLSMLLEPTGPLSCPEMEFNPLELKSTVVQRAKLEPKPRERHRRTSLPPRLDRIDAFVARNRELILGMLESAPVSLSAFLVADEDDINPVDLNNLVEMSTIFMAPYVLGLDEMRSKCVRFRVGEQTKWILKDGWTLQGPELWMELAERSAS
jgi:hypothetical protein